MKPSAQTTFAERVGRTLGRMWWGFVRLERKAHGWLVAQGWAPGVAKAALLVSKLVVLGVFFYATFWLALLLICIVVLAWMARQHDPEEDSDFLGRKAEEIDHREGPFYHPASYDDDPDPRFKDD